MAEPTNHNEAGEVAPSTVEQQAPSVAEEHAPSTESPQPTDIPSANTPDPTTANPEANPNAASPAKASDTGSTPETAETRPAARTAAAAAKAVAGDKPAAKAAKKEKAPAVEDKPFAEFIQQDYLPALKQALAAQGVPDLELTFEKQKVPLIGYNQADDCWQIVGRWQNEGLRQFNLYFEKEDIQGRKFFSCNEGSKPSTLEPFLGDERKVTRDLMIYGAVQRLNGQKWLQRN
ncbi:MAG: DUF2996 domain-containing protein [Chroococcidiopsidaceae cyanobacterium CP_BM_RX_35]|nr:DUF2996 domain-containing protein [Chroococcidiopsidaceae cyanobacterium CP_BM_RX_35]